MDKASLSDVKIVKNRPPDRKVKPSLVDTIAVRDPSKPIKR